MSDRIRLALVITELRTGGAEQCLTNLAIGLDRTRFAPVVYALAPRPVGPRDTLVRRLQDADIPTHFLDVRSSWQFLSAIRRLRRLLQRQAPHIVQTFLYHANVVGSLAAKLSPRPRPRVVLGMRVADPSRRRQLIERPFAAGADRVVCVSRSVAEFCVEQLRTARDKLEVIPNGLDLTRYEHVEPADLTAIGIPAQQPVIVSVGRLHRQKGLDWLLALMPSILARVPRCHLLLVGEGAEAETLPALAATLGIGERVHFVGWRNDVPNILAASSVLVLPSRWEGMPNVVLEAMAAGLPVVSSRVHGVEELLAEAADQQIVSPADEQGFAAQLIQFLADPDLAQEIGHRNRDRIARHFSLPAMIRAYERLYESLSQGNVG